MTSGDIVTHTLTQLANTVANMLANTLANTVANTVANRLANTVASTVASTVANTVASTHQLLTWRMVRPVSWASCFFCSSEGYGCCQGHTGPG